jgi:hypothetical protein
MDFMDLHPLASRYASLMREWVVREGFTIDAPDEKVKAFAEAAYEDPRNDWANVLGPLLDVMTGVGELYLPAMVMGDGSVVFDYFDPADISDVIFREGSNRVIEWVEYTPPGKTQPERLKVISPITDKKSPDFGRLMGLHPRKGGREVHGVLYFRFNARVNSARGRSDYLASMDYWDSLDDYHSAEAEKAMLLSRLVGDVTIEGASAGDIDAAKARYKDTPQYASIPMHNEKETWNLNPPSTGAADASERERMLRRYGSAPTGIPPTTLAGDMETGTRAVATAANDPAYLRGLSKQADLRRVVKVALTYAVDTAWLLNPKQFSGVEDWTINVQGSPLLRKDPTEAAPVMVQVTQSLDVAEHNKWIDKGTARKVYLRALSEVGGEPIDVDEVEAALDEEEPEPVDVVTQNRLSKLEREMNGEEPEEEPEPEDEEEE